MADPTRDPLTGNGSAGSSPAEEPHAEEPLEAAGDLLRRAREWIVEHPGWSVIGAVAAGYLFSKLVARRGR